MTAAVAILRVIIDQGHGASNVLAGRYDPGAVGCAEEAALVREVADSVLQNCARLEPSVILTPECDTACLQKHQKRADGVPRGHLKYKVEWVNKNYKPFDFLISLHCNAAANESASGVEVFYSDGAPAIRRRQAAAASRAMAAVLDIPDRGAKPSWMSQHPRLPIIDSTKVPALLFELGFISNQQDTQRIQERGAEAVIAAITAIRGVK